jgi:hypothetical protein
MASVETMFIDALRARQEDIALSLVARPPTDIAGVMKLHGEWVGIKFALDTLFNVKKGEEDGEV